MVDKRKHATPDLRRSVSLKSTSKLTIHVTRSALVSHSVGSGMESIKTVYLTFSYLSFRNCSHFKVRHVAQAHPVQIARQPRLHFGEGIKVASQSAMPADSTINYTMWVPINFAGRFYALLQEAANGKCLEIIDKWKSRPRKCVNAKAMKLRFLCYFCMKLNKIYYCLSSLLPLQWAKSRKYNIQPDILTTRCGESEMRINFKYGTARCSHKTFLRNFNAACWAQKFN